jgi:hypothetical protein
MENLYAAYTPEAASFHEAAVLLNLRFLAVGLQNSSRPFVFVMEAA